MFLTQGERGTWSYFAFICSIYTNNITAPSGGLILYRNHRLRWQFLLKYLISWSDVTYSRGNSGGICEHLRELLRGRLRGDPRAFRRYWYPHTNTLTDTACCTGEECYLPVSKDLKVAFGIENTCFFTLPQRTYQGFASIGWKKTYAVVWYAISYASWLPVSSLLLIIRWT